MSDSTSAPPQADEYGHVWRSAISPGCDWQVCKLCLTRSTNPDALEPCEKWAEKPWGSRG